MATLPQMTLNFNHQIKLSNDGGALSSDTGELLFREFDEKLDFSKTIAKYLQLKDERSHCLHQNENVKKFINSSQDIMKMMRRTNSRMIQYSRKC